MSVDRYRLSFLIACCFLIDLQGIAFSAEAPRNIVFIMADDLGIGDISHYHRQRSERKPLVETPNLDEIITSGKRFSKAYSFAALCAPTRWSVATGRYATRSRTTMGDWTFTKGSSISKDIKTIGHVAQEAGYKTSFFGKYSLGGTFYQLGSDKAYDDGSYYTSFTVTPETIPDIARGFKADRPSEKGFDYSFIVPSGHQAPPHAFFENGEWAPIARDSRIVNLITHPKYNVDGEGVLIPKGSMLGDRGTKKDGPGPEQHGLGDSNWDSRQLGQQLVDKALSFIERERKSSFFMAYHALAVHKPLTPAPYWRGKKLAGTHIHPQLDMIKEFDLQVGEIIQALKKHKLYEDTMIILTSDNGGLRFEEVQKAGHISNHRDRGYKVFAFEGGFHVPFSVCWPREIQAGGQSDSLISTTDIFATLYHLTGRDVPNNQGLDSQSFYPQLFKDGVVGRSSLLAQGLYKGHWRARIVREGRYKLILGEKKKAKGNMQQQFLGADYFPVALFDLEKDPHEDQNLLNSPEMGEVVDGLSEVWFDYIDQVRQGARSTPTQALPKL